MEKIHVVQHAGVAYGLGDDGRVLWKTTLSTYRDPCAYPKELCRCVGAHDRTINIGDLEPTSWKS